MNKGPTSNHKQLTILRCKLVIIGDACVGKTALTQVFQSGGSTYPKNYLMVIFLCFVFELNLCFMSRQLAQSIL